MHTTTHATKHNHAHAERDHRGRHHISAVYEKDPVCGMAVDPGTAAETIVHDGHTYRFCSHECAAKFRSDPDAFVIPHEAPAPAHQASSLAAATADTEYVCPMHPEIVRLAPGNCPICGMALEPRNARLDEGRNAELADMTRRFWASAALSLPLLLLGMADMLPGRPLQHALGGKLVLWVQLILSTPVVLWGAWPFFRRAWDSLVSRHLNMFTLIGIGVGISYGYSLVALLVPGLFPASFHGHAGQVDVYFEPAAVITTLVLLGQVLELRARSRTSGAIKALLGLAPKIARRILDDGREQDVAIDQVKAGDKLRVRPGERVPVDGLVLDGAGAIDESMVTGESMPVEKRPEDRLTGGT